MLEEDFTDYLAECIQERASDLYILPKNEGYVLQFHSRLHLTTLAELNYESGLQMINYFKYRANMAVSEHRRPQAGALQWGTNGHVCNLRLSSVGDFNGHESLVIRFIYPFTKTDEGQLVAGQFEQLMAIAKLRGLVLFSGPMGSGKTTTMYQIARRFSSHQVVMTIEDPVEIDEQRFIQLQVNEQANMGYEELLRVGLRHRPEIFIIGEIRDLQTAQMAVQAALSGHLVLATVHAKNVFGVVDRLRQLGIEDQYLQQTISGVSYQRLIPTTDNRVAALHDILSNTELERSFGHSKFGQTMTNQWRCNLEQAVETGQITAKTATEFVNG